MDSNDMAVHEALLFEILDRVSRIDMRLDSLTTRETTNTTEDDPVNPMFESAMLDDAIFSFTPTW